jgi:hypothetical protein
VDLNVLAAQIQFVHAAASSMLGCPELALSDPECKQLADALRTVAKQHDIGAVVNPKVQAWMALATVAAMIYLPRAKYITAAVSARKAKTVPSQPDFSGFYDPSNFTNVSQ